MVFSIFIVEDQDIMLHTLEAVLNNEDDFRVVGTAQDARTALDALSERTVDLALVDVSLPKVSGLELVQTLRDDGAAYPCLMLSGRTEAEYVSRAREVGANGFVLKGDPTTFITAIRTVLGGDSYVTPRLKSAWAKSDADPNAAV